VVARRHHMEASHHFVAAQGYFELGMLDEAWARLAELSAEERARPISLKLRTQLHIAAKEWRDGMAVCRQLCDVSHDDAAGYIHGAYCLHELGMTEEARELLMEGPEALREEPIFFYNLGCYEARLGEIDSACAWLLRSFQMDDALRRQARRDPDLKEVWEELRTTLEEI
jgi:predicted Zn-dependent protease